MKTFTLIASFVSLILLGLFYWWFHPNWLLLLVYLLIAALAVLSVPLLYRLLGYQAADDVAWLTAREGREHEALLHRLQAIKADLQALRLEDAAGQADTLGNILDDYHAVVEARFFGKKHSPLNYHAAARQVQKHAVQNLADMVAIGHSMSGISHHTDSSQQDLYQTQATRLQALLDENNNYFDALTKTAVEVANMRSFNQFERTDTLARLVALSKIAQNAGD